MTINIKVSKCMYWLECQVGPQHITAQNHGDLFLVHITVLSQGPCESRALLYTVLPASRLTEASPIFLNYFFIF